MRSYWISWWHDVESMGAFELQSPWWRSGFRDDADSICAAVRADSEEAAQDIIRHAYDVHPVGIEWRFVEGRSDNWSPFNSRFRQADWMKWTAPLPNGDRDAG